MSVMAPYDFFSFIEVLEILKLGLLSLIFENVWFGAFKCIAPRPIIARIGMQVHLMLEVRDDARPMFV